MGGGLAPSAAVQLSSTIVAKLSDLQQTIDRTRADIHSHSQSAGFDAAQLKSRDCLLRTLDRHQAELNGIRELSRTATIAYNAKSARQYQEEHAELLAGYKGGAGQ
eukprot:NODE_3072_length_821_cov_72.183938_g2556_i0.p3 GENE.NODE_3072_length_821_cov_72.183938_g2556_i0~~NODE_3072_length_821_cov_72.183938_g2556_i0.p3  ORF type:complete len:114 (+),score=36.01 NODE_3072_length_821_cov_72.183938_g2556_i0:25-342(+)